MKNDLLKLLDLSGEDIITILNTADQLKYETKHNIHKDYLKGKTLEVPRESIGFVEEYFGS